MTRSPRRRTPGRQARPVVRIDGKLRKRRTAFNLEPLRAFALRLSGHPQLGGMTFDVTLVGDAAIAALNARFRGKAQPTDVLSFPFQPENSRCEGLPPGFARFAGDIVISLETAWRNAVAERHAVQIELQQLVLHGALHLIGYDHEADDGEMNALELELRREFGIDGVRNARVLR